MHCPFYHPVKSTTISYICGIFCTKIATKLLKGIKKGVDFKRFPYKSTTIKNICGTFVPN